MNEYAKTSVQGTAAMKAGMHRETAAKYLSAGQGPQPEKKRGRRRHPLHLKRRLATHLTLRGSRELTDEAAFARFVAEVCTGINLLRSVKLAEERAKFRPLPATVTRKQTKRGCAFPATARCG